MNLGLGLSLGTPSGGGAVPSILDTSTFIKTGSGAETHSEIIDADSFRMARNGTGSPNIRSGIDNAGVATDYTLSFDLVPYDGAETVTGLGLRIDDDFTELASYTAAGSYSVAITVSNELRFRPRLNNLGFRIDNLHLVAA